MSNIDLNNIFSPYQYELKERSSFRNGGIKCIFDKHYSKFHNRYAWIVSLLKKYQPWLATIPFRMESETEPFWSNTWLPYCDAAMLYMMVAERKPSIYMEIGSGNSTKFVAKAIRDHCLETSIISIDPVPRAEINTLCDECIRKPLEQCDLGIFDKLSPGDILTCDCSHRCFPNSDVSVFFCEVMPKLPPGLLYAIHDIALPDECYASRAYNEQYMVAAYLLGGGSGDEIYFPLAYISAFTTLLAGKRVVLNSGESLPLAQKGGFIWLKRGGRAYAPPATDDSPCSFRAKSARYKFSSLIDKLSGYPTFGDEWHQLLCEAAENGVELDDADGAPYNKPILEAIREIVSLYTPETWLASIDMFTARSARGWARKLDSSLPQFIRLKVNGEFLTGHEAANILRKDLVNCENSDDRFGWETSFDHPQPVESTLLVYSSDGQLIAFRFCDFSQSCSQEEMEQIARQEFEATRYEVSLSYFARLCELFPDTNEYRLLAGQCLAQIGRPEAALSYVKSYIANGGIIPPNLTFLPLECANKSDEALLSAINMYLRCNEENISGSFENILKIFNKLNIHNHPKTLLTIFNNYCHEKLNNSSAFELEHSRHNFSYIRKRKLAMFSGGIAGYKFMLPLIKCLPKYSYDLISEYKSENDQKTIDKFGINDSTIVFGKKRIGDYDTIFFDQCYLYGHPNLKPFPEAKYCIYSHGTDTLFDKPMEASLVFSACESQIRMDNKIRRAALTETNQKLLGKWSTYKKCEYAITGPFHIGEFLQTRPEDKRDLVVRLEKNLNIKIRRDRPLVLFLEDEYTPLVDIVEGLNRLAPHATVICKFLERSGASNLGLSPEVVIHPSSGLAPNSARYAADAVICGANSGSFVTCLMLGLDVIPYYSPIMENKFWNNKKTEFESFRRDQLKPDAFSFKHKLFSHWDRFFNIRDTAAILDALTKKEYREWYHGALPALQHNICGYYPRTNCHEIAAEYLLRFACEGTLGKDAFAYYLKA